MRIYNCHTHIFNFACAPNGFLSNFIGRVGAQIVGRLLRVKWLRRPLNWLIDHLPFTKKYAALVQVGTSKSMSEVYEGLASHYPEGTAFAVLTLNFDHMAAGQAPADFNTQLRLVQEVKRKYPDDCLPFLCIDPRAASREELGALVERTFDPAARSGFVGIKLYPSLGFFPFHPNLEKVYQVAEARGIPIMSHCTRAGVYFVKEPMDPGMAQPVSFNPAPPKRVKDRHNEDQYRYHRKRKNADLCDNFLDPVNYLAVLAMFPRLKLCLAHYGGDDEMRVPKDGVHPGWYEIIRDELLVKDHPNVYTDISYTLAYDDIWKNIQEDLKDPELRKRILFGTDHFMTLKEPFTERQLYERFQARLGQADWEQISNTNAKRYLTSDVYAAP